MPYALVWALCTGLTLAAAVCPLAYAQRIEEIPLPSLDYVGVNIKDLSADGSRIAASLVTRSNNTNHAAVINPDGSWTLLEEAPGTVASEAEAISGDGQTISGSCHFNSGPFERVLWNASGVRSPAPLPPTGEGVVREINFDGSVIVGRSSVSVPFGAPYAGYTYRWRSGVGTEILPNPVVAGSTLRGQSPTDISDDGLVVLQQGCLYIDAWNCLPFPYLTRDTMTPTGLVRSTIVLDYLAGGAQPTAISGDGYTAVGNWQAPGRPIRAVLWDTTPGIKLLGPEVATNCTGYCSSWVKSVSADGRAITGLVFDTPSLWIRGADGTPIPPPIPIGSALADRGANLGAVGLGLAPSDVWMSADARVFVTIAYRGNTPVLVRIRLRCPVTSPNLTCVADLDDGTGTGACDGGTGIEDLLYYLNQFEAGTPRADVDDGSGNGTPDGGVGIEDLLYYLTRFEAGC